MLCYVKCSSSWLTYHIKQGISWIGVSAWWNEEEKKNSTFLKKKLNSTQTKIPNKLPFPKGKGMLLRQGGEGLDEVERLILFPVLQKSWGQWKAEVAAAALYPHVCLPASSAWLNGAPGVQEDHLMMNPLQFALESIICSSVPLYRLHCHSVMARVVIRELNRAALLVEICLLLSKLKKAHFVGMEEIREYLQTSQLPRFWKTFQQVSLVAERSLNSTLVLL